MALQDITAWQIDSLRITAFSNQVIDAKGKDWWSRLTGGVPEASGARPQQGEYFESGPFLSGFLEVKTAFNRLDCSLNAFPQAGDFPKLEGSPEVLVGEFLDRTCGWLAGLEVPIARVAFGMSGVTNVDSREAANRIMMDYVPGLNLDPAVVHELGIHLSYPFASKVIANCMIHPLSKWTSVLAHLFTMQPGVVSTPAVRRQQFCRAEFDVFTPAERLDLIPIDRIAELCKELAGASLDQLKSGVQK